jgi:hypothetical protein
MQVHKYVCLGASMCVLLTLLPSANPQLQSQLVTVAASAVGGAGAKVTRLSNIAVWPMTRWVTCVKNVAKDVHYLGYPILDCIISHPERCTGCPS